MSQLKTMDKFKLPKERLKLSYGLMESMSLSKECQWKVSEKSETPYDANYILRRVLEKKLYQEYVALPPLEARNYFEEVLAAASI